MKVLGNNKRMKKILKVFAVVILILVGLLGVRFYTLGPKSQKMDVASTLNLETMTLGVCPEKPNCISSYSDPKDEKHYYGAKTVAPEKLIKISEFFQDSCQLKKADINYWYYVCTSDLFKFADDSELLYKPEEGKLYFRFASRVGYSDLGANKKRADALVDFLGK